MKCALLVSISIEKGVQYIEDLCILSLVFFFGMKTVLASWGHDILRFLVLPFFEGWHTFDVPF